MHAPITLDAVRAGKHVLTDKPMATSIKDAQAMIDAAVLNNVILGVIFQTRWNDTSKAAKKAIQDGYIGKIRGARAIVTWCKPDDYYRESDWKGTWDKEGGGVLIDQAIHSIDLAQWLIEDDILWVKGTWDRRAHDYIEVEDVAEGTVKFKSGVRLSIYASNLYSYDAPIYIEIIGEKGAIQMSYDDCKIIRENEEKLIVNQKDKCLGEDYWGDSHAAQICDFYKCVQKGVKPQVSGEDGKTALEIVLAIYKSGRTGHSVSFPFGD